MLQQLNEFVYFSYSNYLIMLQQFNEIDISLWNPKSVCVVLLLAARQKTLRICHREQNHLWVFRTLVSFNSFNLNVNTEYAGKLLKSIHIHVLSILLFNWQTCINYCYAFFNTASSVACLNWLVSKVGSDKSTSSICFFLSPKACCDFVFSFHQCIFYMRVLMFRNIKIWMYYSRLVTVYL